MWFGLLALLALLVVYPVAEVLLMSLQHVNATPPGLTLASYAQAFGRARYIQGFWNSALLGAGVATLCLVLTVPMAWAVVRTDMPCKRLIRAMVMLTFITPPFLGATSWVLLASPNAGWLNRLYVAATGSAAGPLNIYSLTGLVFVIAIYSIPYSFVFTTAALELVSSEMEDAANILGAGRITTTLRITLPLVAPALLGAWIITYLEAISIIGSSVIIGLPAHINLVPLQLLEFFGFPLRVEAAAAYAMPLLAVTVILFLLQQWMLKRRSYVAQTGKGGERRPIELGHARWLALGWALLITCMTVVLPYLVLIQAAFAKAWSRGFSFNNLTFDNFRTLLFEQATLQQSITNTFSYAATSASLAVITALVTAYVVIRRLVPLGNVLSVLCLTPFAIPGIVLAIGFYAAYAPPPLSLAGTGTILVLAFTARFLPIAFANASAAMRGLNPEMEEAVHILGGGRVTALRCVVFPILKRNIVAVWLLVFIAASREVSSALFLYGPRTRTMSVMFFDLTEGAEFEQLAALGLIMAVTTMLFVVIGQTISGRDFMLRRDSDTNSTK